MKQGIASQLWQHLPPAVASAANLCEQPSFTDASTPPLLSLFIFFFQSDISHFFSAQPLDPGLSSSSLNGELDLCSYFACFSL